MNREIVMQAPSASYRQLPTSTTYKVALLDIFTYVAKAHNNIFENKPSTTEQKMTAPTLPPITSLSTLPLSDQLKALDTLFEPSPELHTILQPILSNNHPFQSYDSLIDTIHTELSALSATNDPQQKQTLYGILGSHPRLGAASPTAQAGLSELSRREQANINRSAAAENEQAAAEQAARLSALNKEYEERYPGLRYVYALLFSGSL